MKWRYLDEGGHACEDMGVYLMCDNVYVHDPLVICPFTQFDATMLKGYFSTNLESVRKDVKCMFGILKKRWKILDHGFKSHEMACNDQIFVSCCVLNNMMLDVMENECPDRLGRGAPLENNGVWLDGHTAPPKVSSSETQLALNFGIWRMI